MSIELVMLSNHLVLCSPLLLPSIFPNIMVFSNESALCIRWPKYWSFSINPSNEYSGLISFKIDWLDLLASLSPSQRVFSSTTIWKHQFFSTQLSFGPTLASIHDSWKNSSFDYIDKSDISVYHSFPSKEQTSFSFMAPVTICSDLEHKKIKSVTASSFSPFICLKW